MVKLWITFGKGNDLQWMPNHSIVRSLCPRLKALPFFHVFRSCDTVSAFVGKGKRQHEWPGMCLRTQHRYAVAYAHFAIIYPRMKSVSLRNSLPSRMLFQPEPIK